MSSGEQKIRMPERLQYGQAPPQGVVFAHNAAMDDVAEWVSDSINFQKAKTLIRAADSGNLATALQFCEEMELKDAHLQGVANTRRKAITRLDWDVVSAAEDERWFRGDRALADEAAKYVKEMLAGVESFEGGLRHLTTAIGPNLAVIELVWKGVEVDELIPIPSNRLILDPQDQSVVRVITTEAREGVAASAPKFVVHTPESCAGVNWMRSISHALTFIYVIKLLAVTDWALFTHRYGIPFLLAKHAGAGSTERTELKTMLQNFGTAGWAMFSDKVSMELVESSQRGTVPQEGLVEWCSRQMSIAFLGQALTTDTTGGTGTYAAASVHNMVRQDLLEDDIQAEGETVQRQIIKPLCIYGFPGRDVPYPNFRRILEEPIDRKAESEVIEAFQRAGGQVPTAWAHERVGIPDPEDGEETLNPSLGGFGEGLMEG